MTTFAAILGRGTTPAPSTIIAHGHQEGESTMTFSPSFMKWVVGVILSSVLWIGVAPTTCLATEWWVGVDQNPRQIAPNAWRFRIKVPVTPAGQLQFVGSQYDFASLTQGITVHYQINGPGSDFSDPGEFLAIAPTLFDLLDGFLNGWDLIDLKDGTFSGVVYATAPLTTVYFSIAAEGLVPVHGR
jgi:hypothetical protein